MDVHSLSKPEEAKVTHYDLDLNVDFNKKIITGKASCTIETNAGTKQLILDTHDLKIDKITLGKDEKPTTFKLSEPVKYLGQALIIDIEEGTKTVNVYYSTSPTAAAIQWLDKEQTAGKKYPFLFTQSQAILARTWIPCQDSPGLRITYSATIKCPKELMAVMSASNPTELSEDGVYHFNMPNPIPSYLLALAIGDIVFKPIGKRTGVYAEPATIDKAVHEFVDLENMLVAAEKLYGPYDWERYDVLVLPPSFPFGGMENPRLTFATPTILAGDRSLTSLIAHELAHSWSGNLVTNATWDDFWMNEGFTVYFERRIMEALYGKPFADMQAVLGFRDLQNDINAVGADSEDSHLKLNLKDRDPDDGMTKVAYEKGYSLLRLIEETIGRERLDAFLKQYFKSHAFQTITTEQFLDYYDRELIKGDTALADKIRIKDWIYHPGIPSNVPQIISERFKEVEAEAAKFIAGTSAKNLNTKDYQTNEWMHFLSKLPESMDLAKMNDLDATFHFTQSGNSEILFLWLERVIYSHYTAGYQALENFLTEVGRRKFVKPLYAALLKTPDGLTMAKAIYAKARQNYHSVTRNTVDEMIGRL